MKLIVSFLVIGVIVCDSFQVEPSNVSPDVHQSESKNPNESTLEKVDTNSTEIATKSSVKLSIDEICSLPPLDGDERLACLAYFPRFFYNAKVHRCEVFIYGGCGGNSNNFLTKRECESFCVEKS